MKKDKDNMFMITFLFILSLAITLLITLGVSYLSEMDERKACKQYNNGTYQRLNNCVDTIKPGCYVQYCGNEAVDIYDGVVIPWQTI